MLKIALTRKFNQTIRYTTIFCIILIISQITTITSANKSLQEPSDSSNSKVNNDLGEWEKFYLSQPNPENIRRHLRVYTEEPHIAGTEQDYQTAVYTRDRLREYGISAEIVEYQVFLPYLKENSLEMLRPTTYKASLKEDTVTEDKDSFDMAVTPGFNAYSANADVTGQLVYVNYGLPADYRRLTEMGVSVKGKIAIARYGRSFRGVKAKVAEENGAIGLLIYSDPADDGYGAGDVFPRGPYRSSSSVQRGSVLYTFLHAGDPLTPGVAATKDAKRLSPEQATTLPKIPVQPLSYRDASPLLEALSGPNVPRNWQGMLPFSYHVGPGPTEVRLKTNFDFQVRKIWNVIGEIKGAIEPEKLVILGNHRDAWVYGAVDPNSGSSAMLEVARSLGELLKKGWKPQRTIVFGSWDAEEFGLIGSTEWVEENAERLRKNAVAYLNVDVAVNGTNFGVSGVPSLMKFAHSAMADVTDPKTGKSIFETWVSRQVGQKQNSVKIGDANFQIGSLGSGSDYTPFLQHIGVPALDMGFSGPYGVYHSIYDSFYWMEKFGDPNFTYHATLTKIWGLMAIRLSSEALLPFNYSNYAKQIEKFIDVTSRQAKENEVDINLNDLKKAAGEFRQAAEDFQEKLNREPLTGNSLKTINETLIKVERAFIDLQGLNLRPWYRHVVYAPGIYAGYEAEVFPALQESIDAKNLSQARLAANQAKLALERAKATFLFNANP
ncbi:MAG: M28 family metallopeptidase [Acidobacteria bacterium]|nr:M28 family metallopeptidase [Acidobacteriota bacterium]